MGLKIYSIVKKNFSLILNSKISALILIISPILIAIMLGLVLQDNSVKNIKLGLFAYDKNNFSESFIDELKVNSFQIFEFSTLTQCKNSVLISEIDLCLSIKKDENITKNEYKALNFYDLDIYADFSKQRVVWGIVSTFSRFVDNYNDRLRNKGLDFIETKVKSAREKIILQDNNLEATINNYEDFENEISRYENDLSNLKNLVNNINKSRKDLSNLKEDIFSINNQADALIKFYPSDAFFVMSNTIDKAVSDVNILDSRLEESYLFQSVSSLENSNLRLYSSRVSNNIKDMQDYFSRINNDLEYLNKEDISRAYNPLYLSIYSASYGELSSTEEDSLGFLDYIFPSIIIYFLIISSIIFSTFFIIGDRSSSSFIRNICSKTSSITIIFSNFISCFIIISFQIAFIFLISSHFLKVSIYNHLLNVSLIIILTEFIFLAIGFVIGYTFNSKDSAIITAISLSFIFIIFSPLITPYETIPSFFSTIIKLSPLTILETKLRQVLIFGLSIRFSLSEILSLSIFLIISSVLTVLFYKANREKQI
ncbi:MAG: ABC transporter permease [Nanoarchaeota archaeon]